MKQHFVPHCYLKAWCDANTPVGHEPYIWRYSKDGTRVKRAAPKKVFRETDMYTITMPDGIKDYRLEQGLHDLEDQFVRLRDTKLAKELQVTLEEHVLLLSFVAAMHNRTKSQRNHEKEQWGRVFETMEAMRRWAETATPEQKRAAARFPSAPGEKRSSLSYDDVKKLASQPIQHLLFQTIQIEVPLLYKLDCAILSTNTSPGFTTSDRPCVWFDPKAYLRPPIYRMPALMYPTIEITLPISPTQIICLNRTGIEGYADLAPIMVEDLNRRTRFHCDEYFIVNRKGLKRMWFDPGIEPDDSWERTHPPKGPKPTSA